MVGFSDVVTFEQKHVGSHSVGIYGKSFLRRGTGQAKYTAVSSKQTRVLGAQG